MFYAKLKTASLCTAGCAAVIGGGLFTPGFARNEDKPVRSTVPAAAPKPDQKAAPVEFRKVMSMATDKPNDFRHAVIAVSNEHKSLLSRNLIVTDRDDPKATTSHLHLWTLDGEKPKRTSLGDSTTLGFIPKSTLCFAVDWGPGVTLYDTRTHAKVGRTFPHELREDTMPLPAVSPDGEILVTRSKLDHLQFWNLKTSKAIAPARAVRGIIVKLEFSADGKWLFSDDESNEVNVWDPATGERAAGPFRHHRVFEAGNFSPKTRQLVTVENGGEKDAEWKSELIVRSSKTWGVVQRVKLAGVVWEVKWLDDTHLLVVAEEQTQPNDQGRATPRGRNVLLVVSLKGEKPEVQTILRELSWIGNSVMWIASVRVAPDGKHFIASASVKGTGCWKVGEEKPLWTKPRDNPVQFGDGDWVLTTNQGDAIVYAVADGTELWRQEKIENVKVQGSDIWVFTQKAVEVWRVGAKAQ